MKKLTAILHLTFAVLLAGSWASAQESDLPRGQGEDSISDNWDNCVGTWITKSGPKYVGEFRRMLPNGQGTMSYADGSKYVGAWKDLKQHGHGTYTWADGDKYVGEFKNDRFYGHGTHTDTDGNKYVGELWENEGTIL